MFAASSTGFQCTGFEINSILVAYARRKACWNGLPTGQAAFVNKDFWKVKSSLEKWEFSIFFNLLKDTLLSQTDLSDFNNVTAFLAPGVVCMALLFFAA